MCIYFPGIWCMNALIHLYTRFTHSLGWRTFTSPSSPKQCSSYTLCLKFSFHPNLLIYDFLNPAYDYFLFFLFFFIFFTHYLCLKLFKWYLYMMFDPILIGVEIWYPDHVSNCKMHNPIFLLSTYGWDPLLFHLYRLALHQFSCLSND